MKLFTKSVIVPAITLLSVGGRAVAEPAGEVPPRIGPVAAPATLRSPLASEVGAPEGGKVRTGLLPGFSYDTSFSSLNWWPQGPGTTTNGDLNIVPYHPTSGGVSAIVPHPSNPDILYIGTVNGGVWRSMNASSTNLSWTPLTDDQLSLSIGALALDPTDATGQTLVAGVGRRSSFGSVGGALIGLLRTTDGGTTWTRVGAASLAGRSIYSVAVRGNLILAGVDSTDNGSSPGLYRTLNGGANFTNMSGFGTGLPAGAVTHLAPDPGNQARFYAHVAANGVYRTDNSGENWVNVTAGVAGLSAGSVALSVFNGNGTNVVYAAELTGNISRVYRSTNQGTNWTQMDSVTANASSLFNGFTADPSNPNLVYLSGLFVRANFPYSGRVVRGDASLPAGTQWIPISSTNGTGVGTAPHTDSRALTFNSVGRLIEGDDGGIYELPIANTGDNGTSSLWRSLNANLQNSEMHSMAYDRLAKAFIGGAQDTGFQEQATVGWPLWNKTSNGDGGDAAVDVTSLSGRSIRYGSSQNIAGFFRATYTNNVQLSRVYPALSPLGGAPGMSGQFVNPIALNAVNPVRLLFGAGNGVYESLDQGNTVSRLSTAVANSPVRMAYGGKSGGVVNPDVIYVGSGSTVLARTNAGGSLAAVPASFPGGNVQGIVLDPGNWYTAYVVGTTKVYLTPNAGASWTDLTGNLVGVGTFHTVEFLTLPAGNAIVVGTDLGAYIMRTATPGVWKTLGMNLPNAPVFDAQYDPVGNVLAISTFGRGAWLYDFNSAVTNVVTTLADSGPGSLREAILRGNLAGSQSYITFAVKGVITLATALPTVVANTTILGPGTNNLAINGAGTQPLFYLGPQTTNRISGLQLINGFSVNAGASLLNIGSTILESCVVSNSFTVNSFGGAVANFGGDSALFVTNCVFVGNRIQGGAGEARGPGRNGGPGGGGAGLGGAIYTEGLTLVVAGCSFVNNRAVGGNGGNGDGNSFSDDTGGVGGYPNAGSGGAVGQPGAGGGFGGGGGGGAGSFSAGFSGGAGGFGGGGGAGGARGSGGAGGANGAAGLYGGIAGGSFSSHSGGGGGGAGLGGAIFARTGVVSLVNCAFTGNLATNGVGGFGSFGGGNGAIGQGLGGAVFNLDGKVTGNNLSFSGNAAATADPDVSATTLVTTLADSGHGSLRQAIYNAAARPGVDTVTFDPSLAGGVIRLTSAALTIDDPSGPVAISAGNLPSGIAISGEGARRAFEVSPGSTVTLDALTVSNCFSDMGAGTVTGGDLRITRCTFNANSAQYVGGVYNYSSTATLTILSSTFSGNSASVLDGAIFSYGPLEIRHSTIVSNTSVSAGGGVRFNNTAILSHNLVARNSSPFQPDVGLQPGGNYVVAGYNLVGDGSGSGLADGVNGNRVGAAGAPIDPKLGALRDNGGLTFTHALLGGSPASDAGDPLLSGFRLLDQRGYPRVANDRVDIGAVEGGLHAFYPFDNYGSADLAGGSVASYQGSPSGPWFNSDHRGQPVSAIALNDFVNGTAFGTNNYYLLTAPHDPTNSNRGLGLQGDFTVSAWIFPRVIGGWKIVLGTTTTPGGSGTPVFGLLNNHAYAAFWNNDLPGSIAINAGQWTHLAWTYNSHGGQMALYVNGRLDTSAVGRPNTTLDANMLLGFSAALANSYFQGFIDEFAIFGEALSASQIAQLAAPNGIQPNAILPAPVLSPGLVPDSCGWNVREIYAHTNDPSLMPYDLPSAEFVANSPDSGVAINYSSSVINRYDSKYNSPNGAYFPGATLYASDNLTPQGLINGDDDYFVLAAATTIQVAVEDDYTFGFASDDGAQLRLRGAAFISSTRLDANNPADPAHRGGTLSYPGNTANSKTLGVTHLTPGSYDVEYLSWEVTGGTFSEVFAARGAKTTIDSSFRLLSPTLFAVHPTLTLVPVASASVGVVWSPTSPCDHLQSATNADGPWTDVPGAFSGKILPASSGAQFFRVAQ